MVIVWRLRGKLSKLFYIPNVLSLQWTQLIKTVHAARLGLELFLFLGCIIYLYIFWCVLFYLGQLSHFPSYFGAGATNLNEPPSSFVAPSHYCWLGSGSIRQCRKSTKKNMWTVQT